MHKNLSTRWFIFLAFCCAFATAWAQPSTVPNFEGRINGANIAGLDVHFDNPTIDFTWDHATAPNGIEQYFVLIIKSGSGWYDWKFVNYPATSTSIPTTGLTDGGTYSIHIKAKENGGAWSTWVAGGSFTVNVGPDVTPPTTAGNFKAEIGGQDINGGVVTTANPTIDFSWDHSEDAAGIERYFVLLIRTGHGWDQWHEPLYPAQTYAMQTSLVDGGTYTYHIKTKDNSGNWNTWIQGGTFTVDVQTVDITPPSAVSNLQATIDGQDIGGLVVTEPTASIDVSWGHATDASGIDEYQVQLEQLWFGAVKTMTVNYPGSSTTLETPPLIDNVSYRIRVRALDNAGNWGPFAYSGFFTVDLMPCVCCDCWSNPQAWPSGQVPAAGSDVTIPAGLTIRLDTDVVLGRLKINGTLRAKRDEDVDISAKSIIVEGPTALLDWGTGSDRYLRRSVITLTGSDPNDSLVNMGAKVLGAHMGGTIQMHGQVRKSWSRLGADAPAGSSTITMAETVDWEVGDSILIVPSGWSEFESDQRMITAINGTTLTLDAPLSHPHKSVVRTWTQGLKSWTADMRAEVGLLTHNITIQGSPTTNGFGGHIMMHTDAYAYVDGVELYHMGQKTKLGRYPWHWHMLGDVGQGQYFKNSSVRNCFNRAITIHGTESTLTEGNFCYHHIGHGFFMEDGSERFNVVRKNVILRTIRPWPGEEVTPSDNQFDEPQNRTPASYWITNPQNTFEDNVAAGTHGTGFWFIFPKTPLGLSADDDRFKDMKPWELPLISFKGNTAHSCASAFDIFDNLNPGHVIKRNGGWNEPSEHAMEDFTSYANELGLYSGLGAGGPTENLVFRNNAVVQNKVGMMFGTNNKVDQSVIVADGGLGINQFMRCYWVYDGPGQVLNSHFVGWDASNTAFLNWTGAATKRCNHKFVNCTTDHPGTPVRQSMPNWDQPPQYTPRGDIKHPSVWLHVLRDFSGALNGAANTNMVSTHPFQLVGDEFHPANWTNMARSPHEFGHSRLTWATADTSEFPRVVCSREKAGTPTAHVYHIHGYIDRLQLPFIVNEGFEYTYRFQTLPITNYIAMSMQDVNVGDNWVARFVDLGKLNNVAVNGTQGPLTQYTSVNSLRNGSNAGYFIEANGDVWIKAVAASNFQEYRISWSGTMTMPELDTDGDEMADGVEIVAGRHPFDASDLAAEFSTAGDFEGWDHFVNISGGSVSGGSLHGTSTGNGDAQVRNTDYDFASSEVSQIQIRMKASTNTTVQLFFATTTQFGYSGSRKVTANYTGAGDFQTVTLNVGAHALWIENITALRLDPVNGPAGKTFEIQWIRGSGSSGSKQQLAETVEADPEVFAWPNPFNEKLYVALGEAGLFHTVRLLDLSGRVLLEQPVPAAMSRLEFDTNTQKLSEGVYMVQLAGKDVLRSLRVVKSRGRNN